MKKRGEITAFYIETLVMIVVMIAILLVLTQILGMAKRESVRAKRLTEAVTIAQSAAESLSAAGSLEKVPEILNLEDAEISGGNELKVCRGTYRWNRGPEGAASAGSGASGKGTEYRLEIYRTYDGELTEDTISVYTPEGTVPVYILICRNPSDRKEAA